ncbi:MAG TPA: NADPH-dependent assimilatory sulfite reductase hemoprotein subunit [Candidatus Binatia bacterium]|nr:NADPH-dependent assimilatory sulfite reductase hemoprotein subunit [Candidatus Binatia bacterium]
MSGESKNEAIKLESDYLRGSIAAELAEPTTHFEERDVQLLKFHGSYQQENRDERAARKAQGLEKGHDFMIRARVPGGALGAQTYLALDELASRYANGTLRATTRQGFQFHGVLKGNLKATIRGINDALLSTLAACGDVNRNVMACPAPLHDRAQAHISEIAHDIAMHLAPQTHAYHEIWLDGEKVAGPDEEPIYGPAYLPRKFKIGIAFPPDNCIDVYTQDIGLAAAVEGGKVAGFTVLVGGGLGMTHNKPNTYPRAATPLCFASTDEVREVVEAIVKVQRDNGDRVDRRHARMKYLVEERGIAWFRGELESRLGRAVADPRPIAWDGVDDHLGWHEQTPQTSFLGIYIENGRIKDDGIRRLRSGLRAAVERFRPEIRMTGQQNILLTGIRNEDCAALEALLAGYGIETDPRKLGVLRDAMACPAMPTCGLAVAESERVLPSIIREIQQDVDELGLGDKRISIRMTGCPNGCARPYMGDIGIVGRSAGLYDVLVGGDWENTRLNTLYRKAVKVADLRAMIRNLLQVWKARRNDGERFGDFFHRVGFDEEQWVAASPSG